MTYELSIEEKVKIVTDHLKSLEINKFDLEATLTECYSSTEDRSKDVDSLNFQIEEINKQQDALAAELAGLKTEQGEI